MIRPAIVNDALDIAGVHVESWRTTYRRLMPDAVLDKLSVSSREKFWYQVLEQGRSQFAFVATDAQGKVVGFVNGGLERGEDPVYTAELYALYLLKEQQGQGYGKALFKKMAERFLGQNHTAMLLWVLSSNPSRGFYEKMGGHYLKTKPVDIGGETLEEVAYGWDDLTNLSKWAKARA